MNLVYGCTCLKCKKPLMFGNDREDHVYYVGNDEVVYRAYVPTGTCPSCGTIYHGDSTKRARKEAMKDALESYWKKHLFGEIPPDQLTRLKDIFKRLVDSSGNHKRRMAQELGLWLTEQYFVEC